MATRTTTLQRLFGVASVLCIVGTAAAQQDFSAVEIQTVPVAEGLHMLVGSGGNIGLSTGEDGSFIVDSQYAPLTEKIKAAISAAGGDEVRFLVNTHWHGDHSGGNENFGDAGALIVAHANVRTRMGSEQFTAAFNSTTPASPAAALPVVTFPDRVTFNWNGDTVEIVHVPSAHTDGDSIIHFTNLNAMHTGDAFIVGGYPFIDVSSGGSLEGLIDAAEAILARSNGDTRIIPGHGPIAGRAEVERYHEVLSSVRDRIQSLIDEGRSEDQVVAANPTAEWDAEWGGGFMTGENFTRFAYQSMTR